MLGDGFNDIQKYTVLANESMWWVEGSMIVVFRGYSDSLWGLGGGNGRLSTVTSLCPGEESSNKGRTRESLTLFYTGHLGGANLIQQRTNF